MLRYRSRRMQGAFVTLKEDFECKKIDLIREGVESMCSQVGLALAESSRGIIHDLKIHLPLQ